MLSLLGETVTLQIGGAVATYDPCFLAPSEATALFDELVEITPWESHTLSIYGRDVPVPRLTCWYGDAGTRYSYSGIANDPQSWTPALARLRNALGERAGSPFNSVLLNYYRDGRDSVAWHADDEPELGRDPVIASVSVGAPRTFWFRENATRRQHSLLLDHGSLLLMGAGLQRACKHAVLKEPGCGPRINLTFRHVGKGR